jgi:hypothetical protein
VKLPIAVLMALLRVDYCSRRLLRITVQRDISLVSIFYTVLTANALTVYSANLLITIGRKLDIDMNEKEGEDYEKKLRDLVEKHFGVLLGRAITMASAFGLQDDEISRLARLAESSNREQPNKYSLLEFRTCIVQYLDEQVKLLVKLAAKIGQDADMISRSAMQAEVLFHHKGKN